ncbi:MAG: hypothetical protein ACR2IP_07795 [Solirubrobacteraceae bacterium]
MSERTTAKALPHHPEQVDDVRPMERRGTGVLPWTVKGASALLILNLLLSVLVTILSLTHIGQLVRLAFAHRTNTNVSPDTARAGFRTGLYIRAAANVLVGVFYIFLIVRLRQGRWWAWRRMVWLSGAGSLGIVYLLTQPYTAIFKVEQVIQLLVLISIGACTMHPLTRTYIGPRPARRWSRR